MCLKCTCRRVFYIFIREHILNLVQDTTFSDNGLHSKSYCRRRQMSACANLNFNLSVRNNCLHQFRAYFPFNLYFKDAFLSSARLNRRLGPLEGYNGGLSVASDRDNGDFYCRRMGARNQEDEVVHYI